MPQAFGIMLVMASEKVEFRVGNALGAIVGDVLAVIPLDLLFVGGCTYARAGPECTTSVAVC